ncbi:MAG: hypothetical protein J5758_05445, partial [Abditibacteriota bacterium]|nr:hypothetical protein [Abditibacteriota bacterium]
MDTERYLRHSPPGRAICKEKECIFTKYRTKLIAIAFILTWLGVSAAFADGMSAVDPHYSGTTVSSHINHGDLVYHLTSPTLPCSHSFVTVFGNSCRTASSTGSYNVVAPVGSALTALSVEFHDRDFFVSADDEYTVWGDNNSTYTLSSSSYPFSGELLSEVYGSVLNSMGISKDLTGVPVGRYPVSLTVTDHGAPPLTGITDAPSSFAFDLWVIDLNERAGSISLVNDGIYEIDLTCAPLDFPHGGECYISASWSGLPTPGQPSVSNLFTDAAYQNPITEDAGSVCVKKWQYGAVGTPKKIYYKRPDSALFSDTIYITLSVGNNVLIQKQLIFTTRSTAMIEHVDGLVSDGHDVSGWWTKNFDLYPATEWQDSNWDGDNNDFIGYDVNDTNRPFVFRTTDRFGLLSAAVRPLENGTLSGYWSVMSDKHGFSDSGMLPNPQDDGNYQLPLGQTNGGFMERINAETVNLEWVISNELIRTKHKV